MEDHEITRLIELLEKWKIEDLNWGEICELRELKYMFSDAVNEYWENWVSE